MFVVTLSASQRSLLRSDRPPITLPCKCGLLQQDWPPPRPAWRCELIVANFRFLVLNLLALSRAVNNARIRKLPWLIRQPVRPSEAHSFRPSVCVLFIGTQFSNLSTAVDTSAAAAWYAWSVCADWMSLGRALRITIREVRGGVASPMRLSFRHKMPPQFSSAPVGAGPHARMMPLLPEGCGRPERGEESCRHASSRKSGGQHSSGAGKGHTQSRF